MHRLQPMCANLPDGVHHAHGQSEPGPREEGEGHRYVRHQFRNLHPVRSLHGGVSDGSDRHDEQLRAGDLQPRRLVQRYAVAGRQQHATSVRTTTTSALPPQPREERSKACSILQFSSGEFVAFFVFSVMIIGGGGTDDQFHESRAYGRVAGRSCSSALAGMYRPARSGVCRFRASADLCRRHLDSDDFRHHDDEAPGQPRRSGPARCMTR